MEPARLKSGHIISDIEYISSIKKKLAKLIDQSNETFCSLHIIKNKGWKARAFYDGEFYEDRQEEALTTVLQEYGYNSFLVVPFYESLLHKTMTFDVVKFPSTPEGVEELRIYGFFDWHILCGDQTEWLILLAHQYDFMIVMGKNEIFDAICSNFPSNVWTGIEEMANSNLVHPYRRFMYTNLTHHFNDTYSSAIPGEVLNIDLVRLKES